MSTATNLPKLGHTTLEELSAGLETHQLMSLQLVTAYKRRIDEVNHNFNAVLEINTDAEAIATALDEERRVKGPRGYVASLLHISLV
jgi:amidase